MRSLNSFTIVFVYVIIAGFYGCSNSEIGESKDVAQETIFQQYSIRYNEGDEKATLNAKFRFAGINGTTLVLSKPSSIQFDNITLAVDSNDIEDSNSMQHMYEMIIQLCCPHSRSCSRSCPGRVSKSMKESDPWCWVPHR